MIIEKLPAHHSSLITQNLKFFTMASILVIDDDPIMTAILSESLEQDGHEVLEADTGSGGLLLAADEQPDLILLDLMLPDQTGYEVCRQLKERRSTRDIPVIFLTSAEGEENELRGFNEGAVDFLFKPIKKPLLCARVNSALEAKVTREKLENQARELRQRDSILSAVNYIANSFLKHNNWREVIQPALNYLGSSSICEHIYFKTFDTPMGEQQEYNWFIKYANCTRSSVDILSQWKDLNELMATGRPLTGPDTTVPAAVCKELRANSIRSYLILPIYINHTLCGCLGLDCSRLEKKWSETLISAMLTACEIIGSAMQSSLKSRERERLVGAITQLNRCVLMADVSGIVFYANPATEQVTGYSQKEIIGCNLEEIQCNKQEGLDCGKILQKVRRGEEWHGAVRNYRKDGSLYEESVVVAPIREELDDVTGFVIFKSDDTEKKRLESIAEAANLMDNTGFVFSGIRHELGNPLNSLKMAISVLRKQFTVFAPEQVEEFLDRSMKEIIRMEYLLYSMKNFNIHEEQVLVSVDLRTFLEHFTWMHSKDMERKGIRLTCTIVTEGEGMVDERALHQVLLNLLTNAVNALEGVDKARITIYLVKKTKGFLQIRFEDNGCGFSEEDVSELFRPFYTTSAKGTGLGLTIVRKMLTAMNCTIKVAENQTDGACFVITIPESSK